MRIVAIGRVLPLVVLHVACLGAAAAEPPRLPRWKDNTGMVFIRGGQFTRGGKYKVTVRSFYMDQYEVTNRQYCDFLNDGNAKHWNVKQEIEKTGPRFVPKKDRQRWPVYCVTWPEAAAYARWAHKRLPTEAEWEYAAGGQSNRKYPWGNQPITPKRANFGGKVGHPLPVGSRPDGKTPEGIYDLSGNVAEWCSDRFAAGYYAQAPPVDPPGPKTGDRHVRRGGCFAMAPADQAAAARGSSPRDYRPKCIGIRCVRSARRVLLIVGENFAEMEFAAFTGILGWATETKGVSNSVLKGAAGAPDVPTIEVTVAGFDEQVRGMGSMRIRPDILVKDLADKDIDRFDAVAIPTSVGPGRGRHTGKGQSDLESRRAIAIVQRVHGNGGIIATMCGAEGVLAKAKLPHNPAYANYPLYTRNKSRTYRPLVFDPKMRTITSGGPLVAAETACLLLKQLISDAEYRAFRKHNPWLFGIKDEFAPRVDLVK